MGRNPYVSSSDGSFAVYGQLCFHACLLVCPQQFQEHITELVNCRIAMQDHIVCLPICLLVCLPACLSACLSVSVCLPPACLSVFLCVSVCQSTACLSVQDNSVL